MEDVLGEDVLGPGLHSSARWLGIEKALHTESLPGITAKLEIGDHDVYLKTAWKDGSIVRLDLTLSGSSGGTEDSTPLEVSLETAKLDLARTSCEAICKAASEMLQSGVVGIGHIIDDWAGRKTFPDGYCPQIPGIGPDGEPVSGTEQKGPLDAAAKYMRLRIEEWSRMMAPEER